MASSFVDPLERIMSSFDITGQGTILGHGAAAKSAPSTPVASRQEASQRQEQLKERAKTASRLPNKKQQMKHAMTVQSAHMITTDFQMLSRPLEDGILLMDRTERKLKLIKSLGELLPQHQYSTEYGNVLERTMKHKAMLAGSIPLDVATDEVDFDNKMHALALDEGARPTTHTKMAAYEAMSSMASLSLAEQATVRLGLMQQRVDRATTELGELRKENVDLRLRLEELNVAQEEIKDLGVSGNKPALVGTATMSSMRSSFDRGPIGAIANGMGVKNF